MTNQECKVKPQIVNVNSNKPVFYPFSIKTCKRSSSCNNINDPYNETRHIKCHEMCKCKCRLDASVCNNKQRWNDKQTIKLTIKQTTKILCNYHNY